MKNSIKNKILYELKHNADPELAKHHEKYFQARKGGYGQGDRFLGLKVLPQRKAAAKYFKEISLKEAQELLRHKVHEARFTALVVLIEKFKRAGEKERNDIASVYLKNAEYINNWDLVDVSAPHISGRYWHDNGGLSAMLKYAASGNLWKERIAVISCFYFIRKSKFDEILFLAETFLTHKHDLIHKAVGWMLRETGKKDLNVLLSFLDKYSKVMPRTMLRYAIEKLSPSQRKKYMTRRHPCIRSSRQSL
jgi:3-methyladenine DNA glycosylase AlkD